MLRQSSFSDTDRYCSPRRQTAILGVVTRFIDLACDALNGGASLQSIGALPVRQVLQRVGEIYGEDRIAAIEELRTQMDTEFGALIKEPVHAR